MSKVKTSMFIDKQRGIGLIELMISLLIGALVLAGVVQMFGTTSRNAVAVAGVSRIQENFRYVFTRITEDITQTGNLGCLSTTNATNINNADFMENLVGLASGPGEPYDFLSIVNGDQNATATTDPAGSVSLGTDTLRLRYVNHLFRVPLSANYLPSANTIPAPSFVTVDDSDADYDRLEQYQVVAITNCEKGAIFMITNDPTAGGVIQFNTGVIAPNTGINPGQFNVRSELASAAFYGLVDGTSSAKNRTYLYGGSTGSFIYYVGTAAGTGANTCATVAGANSGPQYCALFRRQKGINEELVQGVSNMEVFYGWTDANGLLFYSRANGVTDWPRVDRIRVRLEFNTVEGVKTNGNAIDPDESGLVTRTVERTFVLANQL